MPRKPSSVFFLVENPASTVQGVPSMPATQLQAWRLELGDDEVEDVVKRHYADHQIGSRIYVVEDTKVTAYEVGLTLDEVDDARLGQDEDEGENDADQAVSVR